MGAHVSVPMYRRSLPERLALTASLCSACGIVTFPQRPRCPACASKENVDLCLTGDGRLHAWTRIAPSGAPPEFESFAKANGAYYVGIVALNEGPKISAMLVDLEAEPMIAMAVHVVTRRLYCEEGVIRYGFKFAPAVATDRTAVNPVVAR